MKIFDSLTIRDAQDSEREAMQDVTLSAYEEYAAVLGPDLWKAYRGFVVATLGENRPVERIVAELNGGIVGSVLLSGSGATIHTPDGAEVKLSEPYVRLLAVAPSARGRGIGRALIEECAHRAQQSGSAVLTLHTTDMMQVAMRMYERMGFVRALELDFSPVPEVTIKGFALTLGSAEQ